MELGLFDTASTADTRDYLPPRYRLAGPNKKPLIVGIGRYPAARMFDQQKIAESPQFISRIGDDAILYGPNRRALAGQDIDAVVLQTFPEGSEPGQQAATHRPDKPTPARRRRLHGA